MKETRIIKCPKCGDADISAAEFWIFEVCYRQHDKRTPFFPDEPYERYKQDLTGRAVEFHCRCGHTWYDPGNRTTLKEILTEKEMPEEVSTA